MGIDTKFPIHPASRPKWQIVLSALQAGIELTHPDSPRLAWINNKLCYALDVFTSNSPVDGEPDEVRYVIADISLNNFIEFCEGLSEERIVSIAFSSAMEKMKDDRKR